MINIIEVSIFNDEVSKSLDEALLLLSSWGQEWIDLRENIFGDRVIDDIDEDERESLKEKIYLYKFKVGCLGTRKLVVTPDKGDMEFKVLEGLIKTAALLNAEFIRVCTEKRSKDKRLREAMLTASVPKMRKLSEMAGESNIKLVLENKPGSITNHGMEMAGFVTRVNHPNLKICWDAVNSWQSGIFDVEGDYAAVKDLLGTVHLKGAMGQPGDPLIYDRGGIIGEDEFPHEKIIRMLVSDGYTGRITLDLAISAIKGSEKRLDRAGISKVSLERMKEIIKKYQAAKGWES